MLSIEALKHLEANAVGASKTEVRDMGGVPFIVVPEGLRAESVERFSDTPARFRGTFKTRRISDFVGYIKSHHSEKAPQVGIFIDPENTEAHALFDLGRHAAPGWADHVAHLAPKATPAYAALLSHAAQGGGTGKAFTQEQFQDFISDWKDELQFFDSAGVSMEFASVMKAVSRLHVTTQEKSESEIGNYNVQRSDLESIGISAGNGLQLPALMHFSCQPYDEMDVRDFACVLRARPAVDKRSATLVYRVISLEVTKGLIADEFLELICDELREKELDALADSARIGTFAKG